MRPSSRDEPAQQAPRTPSSRRRTGPTRARRAAAPAAGSSAPGRARRRARCRSGSSTRRRRRGRSGRSGRARARSRAATLIRARAADPNAAPGVADLARDAQVVADRQIGEQLEPLERAGDAEPGPLVRVEPADVAAVEQDPARGRRLQAGDDVEQRRLARAVRPDQTGDLAGARVEVDVGERAVAAELDGDLLGDEQARRPSCGRDRSSPDEPRSMLAQVVGGERRGRCPISSSGVASPSAPRARSRPNAAGSTSAATRGSATTSTTVRIANIQLLIVCRNARNHTSSSSADAGERAPAWPCGSSAPYAVERRR